MPRDATETEHLSFLACEELARRERRLPTVRGVMEAIGVQSPEVVGRALKRWREEFIERSLAEDPSLGLPRALVEPLRGLMGLARTEARREIEEVRAALEMERTGREEALAAAHTAQEEALRRAEEAEHALSVFKEALDTERQGQARRIAALERQLEEAATARREAERLLAAESERRMGLERRLAGEVERLQNEKLYLGAEHAGALEALDRRHQAELSRLQGALASLDVANRRQHEDLGLSRARERQAHEAAARLRGEQEEGQRGLLALREALQERERALAEAQASAREAQARAEHLAAELDTARREVAHLQEEQVRASVALAEVQTELAVLQRERAAPRRRTGGTLKRKELSKSQD